MSLRIAIAAACLAVLPAVASSGQARFLGSFHWTYPKPYFGGMSGLDVSEDGQHFVAISDNVQVIKGTIRRDGDRITAMEYAFNFIPRLLGPDGKWFGTNDLTDSEGLALLPDGRFYVSFENVDRVLAYDDWRAPAEELPRPRDFNSFYQNGGLEALAVGADGTLYTLPEQTPPGMAERKLYRYRNGAWDTLGTVLGDDTFLPVGADVGPDGLFYLLERRYVPVFGFASRVRRFRIGEAGLTDEEVLLQTELGVHDNLEGIAVWRAPDGELRLTMLSDDNYRWFQRTEVVEYAVPGDIADLPESR